MASIISLVDAYRMAAEYLAYPADSLYFWTVFAERAALDNAAK